MALDPNELRPQPDAATESKLAELGLVSDPIREAVIDGHNAALRTTENDTRGLAGTLRWALPLRYLGDAFAPSGFRRLHAGGFEVLRSPDGSFDIAVAPGNYNTGLPGMPTTRIDRGPLTSQAVNGNRNQMRLDPDIVPLSPSEVEDSESAPITYLLLHYYDEYANELRMELSVPVEFKRMKNSNSKRGFVVNFEPRLILPAEKFDVEADFADEPGEDDGQIDISVQRRS